MLRNSCLAYLHVGDEKAYTYLHTTCVLSRIVLPEAKFPESNLDLDSQNWRSQQGNTPVSIFFKKARSRSSSSSSSESDSSTDSNWRRRDSNNNVKKDVQITKNGFESEKITLDNLIEIMWNDFWSYNGQYMSYIVWLHGISQEMGVCDHGSAADEIANKVWNSKTAKFVQDYLRLSVRRHETMDRYRVRHLYRLQSNIWDHILQISETNNLHFNQMIRHEFQNFCQVYQEFLLENWTRKDYTALENFLHDFTMNVATSPTFYYVTKQFESITGNNRLNNTYELKQFLQSTECCAEYEMNRQFYGIIVYDMKRYSVVPKKIKKTFNVKKALERVPDYIRQEKMLMKYWVSRYNYFSKFDEGIQMDREAWFSVTPENIAKYTASRCRGKVVIDAFCGVGGNTIQFALQCAKVYAIDINPQKIAMAKNNARIYGVEDKIEFIVGDFFDVARSLKGDIVFLSPPWGGPQYLKDKCFNFNNIMYPHGGAKLLRVAERISPSVVYYLPRNIDALQLIESAGPANNVEIEQVYSGTKFVAVTAYFGDIPKP